MGNVAVEDCVRSIKERAEALRTARDNDLRPGVQVHIQHIMQNNANDFLSAYDELSGHLSDEDAAEVVERMELEVCEECGWPLRTLDPLSRHPECIVYGA